jgi:hypothetical protein
MARTPGHVAQARERHRSPMKSERPQAPSLPGTEPTRRRTREIESHPCSHADQTGDQGLCRKRTDQIQIQREERYGGESELKRPRAPKRASTVPG